ncbi:type III effector protein IpaD/SipD/SspD [Burkholderia thailandensis MSMB121]|uniref:Translocator protein BipD n=2 Tax=Burkholderia humptydooensis TaxID=430531 RepID=A0A7U4SU34_9BURK|nr:MULTISPECIES: type III secretion system needle tip protein SctA [Burkholderia]AGK49783.1 type III effector protein IpaD/SipD/SspD [Burkholderia thailandensis MSMB121]ATF32402.1 IpaD/SipD/SspD family type III secretion system needle tip protein [Burkholderia thailandensis]AJY39271.1 type III effector protein IpaD/SipD/SspD [Burkholderia sp. 2002721687]ALX45381.1 translocator protein BipD [Burkholderia humptydooensis]EIP85423.1 translocator protein BipD [Burkholderia humptydooensis MSMB43]
MNIQADMGRALAARDWQAVAALAKTMPADAGARAMTGDDLRAAGVDRRAPEQKLGAAIDEFASARLPDLVDGRLVEGRRADLTVFDDARVAVRSHALAQRNLLERWETGHLGGTLDAAGSDGGIEPDPILQGLIDVIAQGKSDVDAYATIVEGLTKYFQSVADVMSKLQDYISAKDDKNMKIDGHAIRELLQDVIDHLPTMQLPKGADIARWRKELGDAVTISDSGVVTINPDKLIKMRDSLPDSGDVTWDTARYQAWNTAFSGQKDNIQNDVQTLVEKYSHQNSNFDNLVKVLSGAISTLTDTAKSYLQI